MIKILYKDEPYWIRHGKLGSGSYDHPYNVDLCIKQTGFRSLFKKYKKIDSWNSDNTKFSKDWTVKRIEDYLEKNVSPEVPQYVINCSLEITELYNK